MPARHKPTLDERGTTAPRRPARHSREDLLREGLSILSEGGIDTLTIEALCLRLGVTKGSFYHHFDGREDYLRGLLDLWAGQWTSERLAAEAGGTPRERFEGMVREHQGQPGGPEISIRAWAVRDAMARAYQERVDELRLRRLEAIFLDATGDTARARLMARIGYSLFVGAHVIAPPMDQELQAAMIDMVSRELYRFPA